MANEEHLAIITQGVEAWNKWREENLEIEPDLRNADLSGANLNLANLSEADLSQAYLCGMDLSQAYLCGANFGESNLSGANFGESNLSSASLIGASLIGAYLNSTYLNGANLTDANLLDANLVDMNLRCASLSGANLSGANFSNALLLDADFTNAKLNNTSFANTDLSVAKGLNSVEHLGPSTIGIDTLYKSAGKIPEIFLRGCGFKDWEIENVKLYRPDLSPGQASEILYKVHELRTSPAIQFNSCFISYSSLDQKFSEKLYANLQDKGVRCWFAPEHMKIGDRIRDRIDEAIRLQDKLLLVLSETSIESQWVEQEVETALEKERSEKRTILCPIRLDESVMNTNASWASYIKKTRHIGDFSGWNDKDAYQKAFDRLLRDLKAESK